MIEALGLIVGGPGRDRTGDTWIFSPLLLPAELPGHTRLADHTRFELVISSVTGKHVGPLHQWSRSLLALQYYRDYCFFLQAKNAKSRRDMIRMLPYILYIRIRRLILAKEKGPKPLLDDALFCDFCFASKHFFWFEGEVHVHEDD